MLYNTQSKEGVPWYKGLVGRVILYAVLGAQAASIVSKVSENIPKHNANSTKIEQPVQEGNTDMINGKLGGHKSSIDDGINRTHNNTNIIKNKNKSSTLEQKVESIDQTPTKKKVQITEGARTIYKRLNIVKSTVEDLVNTPMELTTQDGKIKTYLLDGIFNGKNRGDMYYFILAVMAVESSGNPDAENSYGAYGLGQITKYALADYNNIIEEYKPVLIINGKNVLVKYNIKDLKDPIVNAVVTGVFQNHLTKIGYETKKDMLTFYSGNYQKGEEFKKNAKIYLEKVEQYAKMFKAIDEAIKKTQEYKNNKN